ncbi:hypothetical protein LEP1GSC088_1379 [Leptospira interrogans str. L1207]|nr:hypothetical protein LEP1GSC088_1379 [Leptospira interrogans str. L1207]
MEAHHGSIEVESALGKGSKFVVIFPFFTRLEHSNVSNSFSQEAEESPSPFHLKSVPILLSIQDRIYDRAIEKYFIHNSQEFISFRTVKDFSKIPQKSLDLHKILLYDTRLILLETADIPLPFQENLLPFFPNYTIQNPFSLDKLKSILIEIEKEIYLGNRTEKEEYSS